MQFRQGCELLSDFVYSFFEHNLTWTTQAHTSVVNCFQILYIRSLNTTHDVRVICKVRLWIAFRFCIFVLWTQHFPAYHNGRFRCELLSDFVYSFFEHNVVLKILVVKYVVNCFQILYIRSLNTTGTLCRARSRRCELLSDFVYSFFEHNHETRAVLVPVVVNCFQILYIRSLNTTYPFSVVLCRSCELLSDFVYSFFEHNNTRPISDGTLVVNCFQILYIRSLNTTISR